MSLRNLALRLLDDEHGISTEAFELLRHELEQDPALPANPNAYDDILCAVRAQDGRYYLPEGHGCSSPDCADETLPDGFDVADEKAHEIGAYLPIAVDDKIDCPCGFSGLAAEFDQNPGGHCCPECGYQGAKDDGGAAWESQFERQ